MLIPISCARETLTSTRIKLDSSSLSSSWSLGACWGKDECVIATTGHCPSSDPRAVTRFHNNVSCDWIAKCHTLNQTSVAVDCLSQKRFSCELLSWSKRVACFQKWLKTVFGARNSVFEQKRQSFSKIVCDWNSLNRKLFFNRVESSLSKPFLICAIITSAVSYALTNLTSETFTNLQLVVLIGWSVYLFCL